MKATPIGKVTIGEIEWPFRFELEPLMQMEEETGLDVMDGSVFRNIKIRTLVRLIACGLSFDGSGWPGVEQPTAAKLALVAKGVDMADLTGMLTVCTDEFVRCFPKAKKAVEDAVAAQGASKLDPVVH